MYKYVYSVQLVYFNSPCMIWLTQYCLKSKLSIILNLCIYLFIFIIYIYKFKLFIIKQKGKWQYLNIWSPTLLSEMPFNH